MQEQQLFTNNFKILFANAFDAMSCHSSRCESCLVYLRTGDGDLCRKGKELITKAFFLQDEPLTAPLETADTHTRLP